MGKHAKLLFFACCFFSWPVFAEYDAWRAEVIHEGAGLATIRIVPVSKQALNQKVFLAAHVEDRWYFKNQNGDWILWQSQALEQMPFVYAGTSERHPIPVIRYDFRELPPFELYIAEGENPVEAVANGRFQKVLSSWELPPIPSCRLRFPCFNFQISISLLKTFPWQGTQEDAGKILLSGKFDGLDFTARDDTGCKYSGRFREVIPGFPGFYKAEDAGIRVTECRDPSRNGTYYTFFVRTSRRMQEEVKELVIYFSLSKVSSEGFLLFGSGWDSL
jgi:hypothetical protein